MRKFAALVLSVFLTSGVAFADSPKDADAPAPNGLLYQDGWYVLPSRGAVVTNELIDKIQEELDREDARIAGRERSRSADGQ